MSPALLTDICLLQAVEWQCDEATKRACYSKGKSKVSMRQLFYFNKRYVNSRCNLVCKSLPYAILLSRFLKKVVGKESDTDV